MRFVLAAFLIGFGSVGASTSTCATARAADLIEVLPVTDDLLQLHYREGQIEYNGVRPDGTFAPQGDNTVHYSPLDIKAVTDISRYRISSADHKAYAGGSTPVRIGYKAKGTEFNSPYKTPPYLREYWVYAELPRPLRSGSTYTVAVGSLADNLHHYTFTFREREIRSPAIQVSQVGFLSDAPKYAYFSQWMGTFDSPRHPRGALDLSRYKNGTFHLYNLTTKKIARTYRGLVLQKPAGEQDPSNGNWTGADVYSLDFSDFKTPGRYVVVADGMGSSYPFEIGPNVFEAPFRAAMRGLFLQRRGIVKDLYEYGREYPRSHHPDQNKFVYGTVEGEGEKIEDPKPVTGIWGWYADAGDWDSYPSHFIIPYTLLLTYDLRPGNFKDGDIRNRWKERPGDPWTEEGTNGVPDLLDEARWLVAFYRRARHELVRQGLGTGGVPGYVGRDAGAEFQPSWNDKREQYVSREQAGTTYALAGSAAYLAHCLDKSRRLSGKGGASAESAAWIKEAKEAFRWAEAAGEKGERDDFAKEQRPLAAVALYLATGDADYQSIFVSEWEADKHRSDGAWLSPTARMIAAGIYLVACRDLPNLNKNHYAAVRSSLLRQADANADNIDKIGFRVGGVEPGQSVTMNLITVPRTIFQAIAYEVTADPKYLRSIHTALAFVFGGNQENRSRLSGVGQEREKDVFLPDAWYLLDFRHRAYRNPIFPGYSAYGLLSSWDVGGPGSEKWALGSTLPSAEHWPLGERRMRSRYSIAGSEFTTHQNPVWYIFATGYLLSPNRGPIPPLTRPTVALARDLGATLGPGKPIRFKVSASVSTERVDYFYDSHFIGESRDAGSGFELYWNPSDSGLTGGKAGDEVLITAIAYDKQGESSAPSSGGERRFRLEQR